MQLPAVIGNNKHGSAVIGEKIHKIRKKIRLATGKKTKLENDRDRILDNLTHNKNELVRHRKNQTRINWALTGLLVAGAVDAIFNPFGMPGTLDYGRDGCLPFSYLFGDG